VSASESSKVAMPKGMRAEKFWTETLKRMLDASTNVAALGLAIPGFEIEIDIVIRRVKNTATGDVTEMPGEK